MKENAAAILPSFGSTAAACSLATGFQPLETGIEYPRKNSSHTVHAAENQGFYQVEVQLK